MATLELNIDPSGVQAGARQAATALDQVKSKARTTEQANDRLGESYTELRARMNPAFAAAVQFGRGQETVNRALKAGVISSKQAKVATRELEQEYKRASVTAGGYSTRLRGIAAAGTLVGTTLVAAAAKSIGAFRDFDRSLSEVSTLISGTAEETELLDASAKSLAAQFGTSATQQVQAFYQAISAGVGDVAQANAFLITSNKLAVGGVTETKTAVDVLTTATNAYSASGLSAARASDVLFTGVRLGKTTVAELASSLGNVVPIASSVGVSLEEVVAGVAALTSQGQSTSVAVTGIRQTIAGLIKPTSEAQKEAARLGIEFDAAAIKSKGLSGVLKEVAQATGGNEESLGKLFGSVEALNAVLGLIGPSGDKFTETLAAMGSAAGATDEAFEKVNQSLSQRLLVQLGKLGNISLEIGEFLLKGVVPALEFATSRTTAFGSALAAVGVGLAFIFPVTGAILALGGAIAVAADNWPKFQAAGELALEAISATTGITTTQFETLWDKATTGAGDGFTSFGSVVKDALNLNINSAQAAALLIRQAFENVPGIIAGVITNVVRNTVSGIESIVNVGISGIDALIDAFNSLPALITGITGKINPIGELDLSKFTPDLVDLGEAGAKALADAYGKAADVLLKDTLGDLAQSVATRAALSDPRRGRGFGTSFSGGANDNIAGSTLSPFATPSGQGSFTTKTINGQSVTRPTKDLEKKTDTGNEFLDQITRNTDASIDAIRGIETGLSSDDQRLFQSLFEQQADANNSLQRFLSDAFSSEIFGNADPRNTQTFNVQSGPRTFFADRERAQINDQISSLEQQRQIATNNISIARQGPTTSFTDRDVSALEADIEDIDGAIARLSNQLISIDQNLQDNAFSTQRLSGTVGVNIGRFASGGSGTIPSGTGGTDSVPFFGVASPGEPFAFGDEALRGTNDNSRGDTNVTYQVGGVTVVVQSGGADEKATIDNIEQALADVFNQMQQRAEEATRG